MINSFFYKCVFFQISKNDNEKSVSTPPDVRANVRKSLLESLTKRSLDIKSEMKNKKENYIEGLAEEIELELFKFFSKVNSFVNLSTFNLSSKV